MPGMKRNYSFKVMTKIRGECHPTATSSLIKQKLLLEALQFKRNLSRCQTLITFRYWESLTVGPDLHCNCLQTAWGSVGFGGFWDLPQMCFIVTWFDSPLYFMWSSCVEEGSRLLLNFWSIAACRHRSSCFSGALCFGSSQNQRALNNHCALRFCRSSLLFNNQGQGQ